MTEDSLGKAMMLLSQERMSEFLDMMDRFDQLTWEEVMDIITVGVWDPGKRTQYIFEVRLAQENGASRPSEIPNLESHLRTEVADSFHMADKAGITGIGSMVFRREEKLPPWGIYNPTILTANYDEGGFGVISGPPRKGKTNLGCVIIEEWVKRKKRVAFSNILRTAKGSLYTYTPSIRDLFQAIAETEEGIRWLLVLDEGTFVYSRPDQITKRVKELDKLMRIVGKMYGNMILIEHLTKAVPAVLQEFATSYYYCHKPGIVTITLKGPNLAYQTKVHSFAQTSIPFDTRDWAYFKVEGLDLQGMYDAVSGAKDRRAAMREFLERVPPLRAKRRTKADKIRELLKKGMTPKEIAKETSFNYDYVWKVSQTSV